MFYKKPKDVRYVDMCKWIDEHVYTDEQLDDEKFYSYLYLLSVMLAYKARFFRNFSDYDTFGIFAASRLFMRYKSSTDEEKRIKSVLNYLKRVIGPYKVLYQQEEYKENIISDEISAADKEEIIINDSFHHLLVEQTSAISRCDFQLYLENICRTVKKCLSNIPRSKYSSEYENIYLSCLLTILNGLSLSTKEQGHLNSITRSDGIRENLYDKLYSTLSTKVILFHLDNSMQGFIAVQVNKIKATIREELHGLIYSDAYIEDSLQNIYQDVIRQEGTADGYE